MLIHKITSNLRRAITARERLSVGRSTVSSIIQEMCEVLYHVLKEKYMKVRHFSSLMYKRVYTKTLWTLHNLRYFCIIWLNFRHGSRKTKALISGGAVVVQWWGISTFLKPAHLQLQVVTSKTWNWKCLWNTGQAMASIPLYHPSGSSGNDRDYPGCSCTRHIHPSSTYRYRRYRTPHHPWWEEEWYTSPICTCIPS